MMMMMMMMLTRMLQAMKQIIQEVARGNDQSEYFPNIVKLVAVKSIEVHLILLLMCHDVILCPTLAQHP